MTERIGTNAEVGERKYRPPMTRDEILYEIDTRIITVPNSSGVPKMKEAKNMTLVPRLPSQPDGEAYLCAKDLNVPESEEPFKHENNSDSRYGVDGVRIMMRNGLQGKIYKKGMPAGGKTSWPPHVHGLGIDAEPMYEHYVKRSGIVYIDDGNGKRLMNEYEVIPPNTIHFLETPTGAILDIIIENVKDIPENKIHQFQN